jgi:phospholipid/cholesterol/gamma-HCH transport system substrate-binding protein
VKIRNEVKVGILVTAALAALLWGLNYLKGKDVFTSRNRYFAVYNSVDGLVASNPVLMNGFRIGIVNSIDFMPDNSGRLLVELLVDREVFVSRNSVARIYNSDLIGTKALRIDLGNDPQELSNNDTLPAELEQGLAEKVGMELGPLREKTEDLIVSIDSMVNVLKKVFDPTTRNNLQSGIGHMNNTLAAFDHMVNSDKGKLKIMIDNMASISTNLRNNNEQISRILQNLHTITDTLAGEQFASAIRNANEVMKESNEVMAKINRGEGSLGLLVNDDRLYNHLDSTAASLDKLLIDLQNNPKRYVHFSVFGKKQK